MERTAQHTQRTTAQHTAMAQRTHGMARGAPAFRLASLFLSTCLSAAAWLALLHWAFRLETRTIQTFSQVGGLQARRVRFERCPHQVGALKVTEADLRSAAWRGQELRWELENGLSRHFRLRDPLTFWSCSALLFER